MRRAASQRLAPGIPSRRLESNATQAPATWVSIAAASNQALSLGENILESLVHTVDLLK